MRHDCATIVPLMGCAWCTLGRLYCPAHVLQPSGRQLTRSIAAQDGGAASAMSTVLHRGEGAEPLPRCRLSVLLVLQAIGRDNLARRQSPPVLDGPNPLRIFGLKVHAGHWAPDPRGKSCGNLAHCFSQPPSLQAYMSKAISSWHLIRLP